MRRILRYFRARRFECDLAAEIQAHLDEKADDLAAEGVPQGELRLRVLRQFGNRTRVIEASRDQWIFRSFDEALQDLRYTARVLRRSPAFTAAAMLSLALGIGANTIIFSVVDQVLLRSLPYLQPGRLFAVWSRSAAHGAEPMHVSPADFYDWRTQSQSLESLSAYANWPMNLTNVAEPRRLETELVSANLFSTLGSKAQIGRIFLPEEDQEQSPFVVVISHHLWQAMGGSLQIVGQRLTLNGAQATVVGIMPAGFAFPSPEIDAWVPLSLSAQNRTSREGRWLAVIGRLRAGVTSHDAEAEMDVITRRLAAAYPATNRGWSASLVPLQDELVGKTRPILLTLQAAVLLLLLITCANIANLLLAKGTARRREIGVRAALGAGRRRIVRQLMMENLALASAGAVVGLALAMEGIKLMRTVGDGLIPRAGEVHLSAPIAIFALATTIITTLLFGLGPALHVSRAGLREQISSGTRGTPLSTERKRRVLVIAEVGLASVLLVGAGLLAGSLVHLLSTAPGLRTDHLLSLRITLPHSQYPTNARQLAFFDQILGRARGLPGVLAAGEVSETPFKGNNPSFDFMLERISRSPSDAPVQAGIRAISTGYLSTTGNPLLKGRDLTADDRAGSMPVVLERLRSCWPEAAL
jgi:putative ABC transport system permease protein